jgi:hypothetical protein
MASASQLRAAARALDDYRHAADPESRLHCVRKLTEAVAALETETVRSARKSGLTWTAIGAAYGMSKQAAQQRFKAR